MNVRRRISLIMGAIFYILVSCSLFQTPQQIIKDNTTITPLPTWKTERYSNEMFSFTVPKDWSINEGPSAQGQNAWNYRNLGLTILVEVRSPTRLPMVTITSLDMPADASMMDLFNQTYDAINGEITRISDEETNIAGQSALTRRYNRPWGEPWYTFQESWVEWNNKIYVIACMWQLDPSRDELEGCDTVLSTFQFNEPESGSSTTTQTQEPPTQNTFSGTCQENENKIAFSYDPMDLSGVHYGIYIMDADGSNRKRLSSEDMRNDRMPAWSPERCRIAYTTVTENGDDDIHVMNADGSNVQQLTTDPARDIFPEWSPDGKHIAFISYRDGFRNLFVMNADGSDQRQLTFNQNEFTQWLDWSPDGMYITYTFNPEGEDDGESLYVIQPDGNDEHQITPPAGRDHDGEPAWSPDGKTLYFLSNRGAYVDIWKINRDGSGLQQISNVTASGISIEHSLRISPDGKQLLFYGIGADGVQWMTDLFVINVDGSGITNLTKSPGKEEWADW